MSDNLTVKDTLFRHANLIRNQIPGSGSDAIFVKEKLLMSDGSLQNNLRTWENYERPFWITTKRHRNHKQNKEREFMNRLDEYRSTQRHLVTNIKRAMQNPFMGKSMRELSNSPYLYGTDVEIETVIANDEYKKKRTTSESVPYEYGALDIETYVADNAFMDQPIMLSFVSDKVIQTTVHRHFIRRFGDQAEKLVTDCLYRELGKDIEALGLTFKIDFVDDPGVVCAMGIQKVHTTTVDTVGIWNINFDLPRIEKTLERYNYDVGYVFSDPEVPSAYRYFKYYEGPNIRTTDAGKILPLAPAERWHYARFPAKWNVVDSMCIYAELRTAAGKMRYGLDPTLNRELGRRKLKFDKDSGLVGLEWHAFMQQNYPIEYIVYNIFDCLGMVLLDKKTCDVAINFPMVSGLTHVSRARSNPKKFCNDLHFRLLEKEDDDCSVLGTAGSKESMVLDIDEKLPDKRGWVMTLSADMMEHKGMPVIKGLQEVPSSVFGLVSDLDIEGTYPNEQIACNMAKETTKYEVQSIAKTGWDKRRRRGVQLNAGAINAVQLANEWFGFPCLDELLTLYESQH